MSNLVEHAKKEFQLVGWSDANGVFEDDMQGEVCSQVCELLELFSSHRHSGTSAPYAIRLFEKLARFQVLSPLTNSPEEWSNSIDPETWQNVRDSRVFKYSASSDVAYMVEGYVFVEICHFTNEEGENVTRASAFTNTYSMKKLLLPCDPDNLTSTHVTLPEGIYDTLEDEEEREKFFVAAIQAVDSDYQPIRRVNGKIV